MTYPLPPAPTDPVCEVMNELLHRVIHIPTAVSARDLLEHVTAKVAQGQEPGAEPTFYSLRYAPVVSDTQGQCPATARLLQPMLNELEFGLRYCVLAKSAPAKPLRELLQCALEHCSRFDDLHDELQHTLLGGNVHCRRGGKARHRPNGCAWLRAARLIMVMAPEGGWQTEAHAARVIEPRLVAFIRPRRLTLVCDSNLRRTIVRWIRQRAAVRAAYLTSRSAQA